MTDTGAARPGAAKGRRIPVVVVLVGLLVAAIVAGNRRETADAGVEAPKLAASMPTAGVRSSAWYCAGGPVGSGPSPDRVTISNVATSSVRVALDVLVAGRDVAERLVTVAGRTSRTAFVAKLSSAPSAALVVQPFGGNVLVEQGYARNGDVAMAPCATRASSNWYFAAGSTALSAQQWLSILNPFAVDAVVDVEAYTESGLRVPGSLQGLVIPHASRVAVRIDRAVAQQRIVALAVRTRNDARIVATQAFVRPRPGNRVNTSLSLGAPAPARLWLFADNRSRAGATQQLVLADPGDTDATVRVSVVADVATVIEPRIVRVPATGAVAVDFSGAVPPGVSYTLVVRSAVPVVAETRVAFTDDFPGSITEIGATATARRWVFAGGPFTATGLGGAGPRVPPGAQVSIVMKVDASDSETADVRSAIERDGRVQSFTVVSRARALVNFQRAQRDNPSVLAGITADKLPVSFNLRLKRSDSMVAMPSQYARHAGVGTVVSVATQSPLVADDVVVMNPGSRALRVSLVATAQQEALSAPGMTDVLLAPGRQVTISLLALTRTGVAVVVNASGPVVAERFTAGPFGVTRSSGVPAP